MNAQELFLASGRSAGVWFCEQCRTVQKSRELADKCCTPNKCRHCGNDCEKYWTACKNCLDADSVEKERQRFEKAEKVREFDGMVFLEGFGFQNGYFDSVADFIDWWEGEHGDDVKMPEYVWACTSRPSCRIDLDRVIEDATQDAHDEYDPEKLTGVDELRAAIDRFNEVNKADKTWTPDFKIAVLL